MGSTRDVGFGGISLKKIKEDKMRVSCKLREDKEEKHSGGMSTVCGQKENLAKE